MKKEYQALLYKEIDKILAENREKIKKRWHASIRKYNAEQAASAATSKEKLP